MVVHALRGCGMDPGLSGRRRGALDRLQRRLGGGGVARGRGRRVRPLAAQARSAGRRAHQRRARPPRDLLVAARRRRHVPRLPGPGRRGGARRRAGPDPLPGPRGAAGGRRARARRLALHRRRRAGHAARPGRPQRPQRRGRARRLRAGRRRPGGGRGGAGGLRRRRPAVRARSGRRRSGALVVDDYAHHPTEVRATIAAARTLAPRRVVAVFQPHLFSRTRHQYREFGAALARGRPGRRCSTSTRRASAPRTSRA